MRWSLFRLRTHHRLRQFVARLKQLLQWLEEQLDRNLLRRWGKVRFVWRFVLVWLGLFVLLGGCVVAQLSALNSYYQVLKPTPGGLYSEGMVGAFTTANPLYAVSDIDTNVSRLLFASLLSYDGHNQLAGDLADRWDVNGDGTVYTVHLRPNLTWQDGQPLTSADVAFTYRTIQNPDARSPLLSSWQGVQIATPDSQTITFTLPNPLSSFPYSLTNGIVPQHLLQSVSPVDLRSISFDTADPVGAGPFQWSSIGVSGSGPDTEEQISLLPFRHYWAGMPQLTGFSIYAFPDSKSLRQAYDSSEITAMVGLDSVPASVNRDQTAQVYNLPLTAGTFVFFKTSSPLLGDGTIRQALIAAVNPQAIVQALGYPAVRVDEPLLKGQLGYNSSYTQATNNPLLVQTLLNGAGWRASANRIRSKSGQPLSFTLAVANTAEYSKVAQLLSQQWRSVGVDAKVVLQPPDEFQATLSSHSYDAVLDGISIGVDPDVFVYWDSSQADIRSANRLNFSEYKSKAADVALEAGRTRLDPQLRTIKYKAFLQAWQQDAPALGLYQPRLLYISRTPIYGLGTHQINSGADRFDNVQHWMIHLAWVNR